MRIITDDIRLSKNGKILRRKDTSDLGLTVDGRVKFSRAGRRAAVICSMCGTYKHNKKGEKKINFHGCVCYKCVAKKQREDRLLLKHYKSLMEKYGHIIEELEQKEKEQTQEQTA